MTNVILVFILIMSIIAFFVMGYDKSQAKKMANVYQKKPFGHLQLWVEESVHMLECNYFAIKRSIQIFE